MSISNAHRTLFRCKFLFAHPIRSFRHLISGDKDYSKIKMSELETYLSKPKVIIEAGAADGVDTSIFSDRFPGATIFAVEPVKEQYDFLVKKMANRNHIRLSNVALSNRNEDVSIFIGHGKGNLGGMGSSSLLKPFRHRAYFPDISFSEQQIVNALTLESFIERNKIDLVDLLWLDIQGKELDVLLASRLTLITKVKLIHLEISRVELYQGMPTEEELRNFLKYNEFKCVVDRVGAIAGNALYLNTKLK